MNSPGIVTCPLISSFRTLRGVTFAAVACAAFLCPTSVRAQTKDAPPCGTTSAKDGVADTKNVAPPVGTAPRVSGVEVLSDTKGVDFAPYIRQILKSIFNTWLPLIPAEGRPPRNMSAETSIRFSIAPGGQLLAMHLDASTGQEKFDRAAWGAITGVGQFPPLPAAFTGPCLELRVNFLANMKPKTNP